MNRKYIGYFSELNLYADNGSIHENIVDNVEYNKEAVIEYLANQKRIASCPKVAIDCITGKEIAKSFSVFTDGEFEWCDFLIHYIKEYNIKLPKEFIEKVEAS